MEQLKEAPHERGQMRLHAKDREKLSSHISSDLGTILDRFTRDLNVTKSWYVVRCVIEGLMRDHGLHAKYLFEHDNHRPSKNKVRRRYKTQRKARREQAKEWMAANIDSPEKKKANAASKEQLQDIRNLFQF